MIPEFGTGFKVLAAAAVGLAALLALDVASGSPASPAAPEAPGADPSPGPNSARGLTDNSFATFFPAGPGSKVLHIPGISADNGVPRVTSAPCTPENFTFSPFSRRPDGDAELFSGFVFNPCERTFGSVTLYGNLNLRGQKVGSLLSTLPRVGPGATPFTFIAPRFAPADREELADVVPRTWDELLELAKQLSPKLVRGGIRWSDGTALAPEDLLSDPFLEVTCREHGAVEYSVDVSLNGGSGIRGDGTLLPLRDPSLFFPCPGGALDYSLAYDELLSGLPLNAPPTVTWNPRTPITSGPFAVYGTFHNRSLRDELITGFSFPVVNGDGSTARTLTYNVTECLPAGQSHDLVARPTLDPGQHFGPATFTYTNALCPFLSGGPVTAFWPTGTGVAAQLAFFLVNGYDYPVTATQAGVGFTNSIRGEDDIIDFGLFAALQNFRLPPGQKVIITIPFDPVEATRLLEEAGFHELPFGKGYDLSNGELYGVGK